MIKSSYTVQILEPSEGMLLFNGETYSDRVYLGEADSADNWREVPIEEALRAEG